MGNNDEATWKVYNGDILVGYGQKTYTNKK